MIDCILKRQLTLCQVALASKKRVLQTVSELIKDHLPGIDAEDIFSQLVAREKLGSTGIGHGIAIPHCRCPGLAQATGCLVTLRQAIDFDAMDSLPVDVLFVLLMPGNSDNNQPQTLADLARLLDNPELRNLLRQSSNEDDLFLAATTGIHKAA